MNQAMRNNTKFNYAIEIYYYFLRKTYERKELGKLFSKYAKVIEFLNMGLDFLSVHNRRVTNLSLVSFASDSVGFSTSLITFFN